jgi:hypothetical protein
MFTRIHHIILSTITISLHACDSRAGSTGSPEPTSSDTSAEDTGEPMTTGSSSGSTGQHQTGCESSSQTSGTESNSGSDTTAPTSAGTDTEAPGVRCAPFRVGACSPGDEWCSDLFAACVSLSLENVSQNFCAGLAIVCEAGNVSPCEICEGVTEQCVLSGRPAWECNLFAETCACLVDAHGV